jgi:predicted nucleotidyltransferase
MLSQSQISTILETIKKVNPTYVAVFGSYARSEQTASSDLDLLFDYEGNINLLDIIGVEQDLSESLGIKVDLISRRSLNPHLKDYIQNDLVELF